MQTEHSQLLLADRLISIYPSINNVANILGITRACDRRSSRVYFLSMRAIRASTGSSRGKVLVRGYDTCMSMYSISYQGVSLIYCSISCSRRVQSVGHGVIASSIDFEWFRVIFCDHVVLFCGLAWFFPCCETSCTVVWFRVFFVAISRDFEWYFGILCDCSMFCTGMISCDLFWSCEDFVQWSVIFCNFVAFLGDCEWLRVIFCDFMWLFHVFVILCIFVRIDRYFE